MRTQGINRIILIILLTLFIMPAESMSQRRPKVGLVLSGGGAKGFAHIEILKMLDSLNFPVDYIAGTSMGGIVGGFYATGYTGREIEEIIINLDWNELFNDKPGRQEIPFLVKAFDGHFQTSVELHGFSPKPPSGFIAGQKIIQTFSKYTSPVSGITNFDDFPIPYRCVAVDLVSGKPITLKEGYLALAMRSTMSIPSAFAPVKWGDYLFVDGGIMNNMPADVAQEMGAEFIISVNVGAPKLKRDEINSAVDVMMQSFFLPGYIKEDQNIELSDIVITPDITAFGTGDFSKEATKEILEVGRTSANAFKDSLANIMAGWGLQVGQHRIEYHSDARDSVRTEKQHIVTEIKTVKNSVLSREKIISLSGIKLGTLAENIDRSFHIKKMMDSGYFLTAELGFMNNSDSTSTALIRVTEKIQPQIHKVEIHGHKTHSFEFIYSLLGVTPGDYLDRDELNKEINKIFGLGYFRTIYYTVEPAEKDRVTLHIWVDEKQHTLLYLGFKYMQEYKLVGSIGLLYNNLLVNGLRNTINLDFAGYTYFDYHISYPSLGLDFPVYPFFRLHFDDIEQKIYTESASPVASYDFRRFSYGAGVGFLLGNSMNIELELAYENFKYKPTIADSTWKKGEEEPTMFFGKLVYDDLDDALIPNTGLYLKGYWEAQFYTDVSKGIKYNKVEIMGDYYIQLNKSNNLKLTAYFANSRGVIPYVRYFASMNPINFFGMDFFKIRYTRLTMLGVDYRIKLSNSFYASIIANGAYGLQNHAPAIKVENKPIIGLGGGLSYNTVIGLITFKAGLAETTPYQPGQHEFWSTLYIGFKL